MISSQQALRFALVAFAVLDPSQALRLRSSAWQPERSEPVRRGLSNAKSGQTTFTQLVDHVDTSLGTFQQRYWWSSEFWAGQGSPVRFKFRYSFPAYASPDVERQVVLVNAGEVRADGSEEYLTVEQFSGALAKELGAAVVAIERESCLLRL